MKHLEELCKGNEQLKKYMVALVLVKDISNQYPWLKNIAQKFLTQEQT